MDTVQTLKLTRAGALKVIDAAIQEAQKGGRPISVAVVDDGGHLLAFARMDNAELTTIAVSQAKARGAALTRFPTGKKSPAGNERTDHHALAITLAAGPDSFVTMPGGFPISVRGQVVGAVGISGAGHNDGEIAKAAAAALEK